MYPLIPPETLAPTPAKPSEDVATHLVEVPVDRRTSPLIPTVLTES
jgi:hypothetical protein